MKIDTSVVCISIPPKYRCVCPSCNCLDFINTSEYDQYKEEPSLPSNLDEAAEEYEDWVESYSQSDFPTCVSFRQAFKAGAEWMAKQGVSMEVVTGVPWRAVDAFIHDHDYAEDSIIQIRKK